MLPHKKKRTPRPKSQPRTEGDTEAAAAAAAEGGVGEEGALGLFDVREAPGDLSAGDGDGFIGDEEGDEAEEEGEGERDGQVEETPQKPKKPKTPKSPGRPKSRKTGASGKTSRSKSPKSPKSGKKSPKGARGKKSRSKSPKGRSRDKQPKEEQEEPEAPPPEPWQPRGSIPDYENIEVTESLIHVKENFYTVIEYLSRDEGLKNYTSEFVRLFEAVAGAHDRKRELAVELEEQRAAREEDARTIARLREQLAGETTSSRELIGQLKELRAQFDACHQRELDNQGIIDNMREEVDRYQEEMRQHTQEQEHQQLEGAGAGSEEAVDYERLKKKLAAERVEMTHEMTRLRKRLADMYETQDELQRKNSAAALQLCSLGEKLHTTTNDVHREVRLKEKLEEAVDILTSELDEKTVKEAEVADQLKKAQDSKAKLEKCTKEQRAAQERQAKDIEALTATIKELNRARERDRADMERLKKDHHEKALEIVVQTKAITKLQSDLKKAETAVNQLMAKIGVSDSKARQVEDRREEAVRAATAIARDLEHAHQEVEEGRREVADLQKTKTVLQQKVVRGEESYKLVAENLTLADRRRRGLEEDMSQFTLEANKQRRLISVLEAERERHLNEMRELSNKVQIHAELLDQKQDEILDYKNKLADAEVKLQKQVNTFEQMYAERNQFEKKYEESREHAHNFRAQAQMLSSMLEQLKETVSMSEFEVKRLGHALLKADRLKQSMAKEINDLKSNAHELAQKILYMERFEVTLKKSIAELEAARDGLQQSVRQVQNERDIIGTQLVRRNDEIRLLLAKVDVLQHILAHGEAENAQRLEDVRLLKLEVRRLRGEKLLLQRDLVAGADLRRELYHLSKDLALEKQRRVALEEEMQTPMNVHRWRRLEATDPANLELIQKVNILQKRSLHQHSQLLAKERQLQDAEKLYLNLRTSMMKLPGPDAMLRLKNAELALADRTRKIKSLYAELTMSEATVQAFRADLNRAREELVDFKSIYYTAKKKLDALGRARLDRDRDGVRQRGKTSPSRPGDRDRDRDLDDDKSGELPSIDATSICRSVKLKI